MTNSTIAVAIMPTVCGQAIKMLIKLTRLLTQDEVTHVRQTAAKLRTAYKPPGK